MIGGDDDDDDAGGADVGREVKRQRVEVEEPVPPSELNKDDRVRVQWASTEQFDGTVTDKMTKLVTAKESVSGARVAYDNGSDALALRRRRGDGLAAVGRRHTRNL